jgi:photosystem II stability/assembly factor-like uncharacterized protein
MASKDRSVKVSFARKIFFSYEEVLNMKRFLFILILCDVFFAASCCELYSQTQWEQLGPYGGTVSCLKSDGKGWVYAGIYTSGVFRSANGGRTWEPINMGLPAGEITALSVAPDGRIYCGGKDLLAVSSDQGSHWTSLSISTQGNIISNIIVFPDSEIVITYAYQGVLLR